MKSKIFFLAILFFCNSKSFAEGLAQQILAHKEYCVAYEDEEKIHFRSEVIFPAQEGIYIALNVNEYLLIPFINADDDGYYLIKKKTKKKPIRKKNKTTPPLAKATPSKNDENKNDPKQEKKEVADDRDSKEKENPSTPKEKNRYEGFETEIVANSDEAVEQVWDQDGKELTREEIEQLPDNHEETRQS